MAEQIILCDPAINWTWYSCYTKQEDGVYTLEWSDRFHKHNPDQGSGNHPEYTHSHLFSISPAESWKKDPDSHWPKEWVESADRKFNETCAAMKVNPERVLHILKVIPRAKADEVLEPFLIAVAK